MLQVRPLDAGEEPLVFSSWLQSYRGSHRVNGTPSPLFFRYHHPLLTDILSRKEIEILCAVDLDPDGKIYGWMCYEWAGPVLVIHYCYVKQLWRKKGIARMLLSEAGFEPGTSVAYTFESSAAPHLAKKFEACEYVPIEEYLA